MADEQRIAVLEQHVRALYEQIAALRGELKGARVAPSPLVEPHRLIDAESVAKPPAESPRAPPPPPPPARPIEPSPASPRASARRPAPPPELDLEKLFGRYGTIAVAALAILMGVGSFLSWAIEHGLLGPTVRVVLGFVGAAVVASIGIWIRNKRDVRFGNVLLALSLAIVHVDAWAAGPHLQVLSTFAALAIAAAASAALAVLALGSGERTLFAIGFAGALIAPFVTAREPGSLVALLTYGWAVIALSLFAIREKGWQPLLWLTVLGAAGYVLAGVTTGLGTDHSWLGVHSPVLFAFACAGAGLLFARDTLRSKLALAFLLLACLATLGYSISARRLEVSVSLVGTLAAYLIARELETDERWLAVGNVIVPLGFLFATMASASDRLVQTLAAAALTAVAGLLAWEDEEERADHLFVAAIASGVALFVYLADFDARRIGALALHAALFSMILRSTRAWKVAIPITIGLFIASVWSAILLSDRPDYAYTPFLTIPSLCTLATVGASAVFAFALRSIATEGSFERKQLATVYGVLAALAVFWWIRQELVGAWSPDASSFALIIYYALAGLALIFAGRSRSEGVWRAAGLALAFYAGYKALVQSFTFDAVALRVGARILVGAFLAAVAYWYRAPRASAEHTADEAEHAGATAAHGSA